MGPIRVILLITGRAAPSMRHPDLGPSPPVRLFRSEGFARAGRRRSVCERGPPALGRGGRRGVGSARGGRPERAATDPRAVEAAAGRAVGTAATAPGGSGHESGAAGRRSGRPVRTEVRRREPRRLRGLGRDAPGTNRSYDEPNGPASGLRGLRSSDRWGSIPSGQGPGRGRCRSRSQRPRGPRPQVGRRPRKRSPGGGPSVRHRTEVPSRDRLRR